MTLKSQLAAAAVMVVAVAAPGSAAAQQAADPCVKEKSPGDTYKICFDPGNRLFVSASARGIGAGLFLRHKMLFDDEPDLTWKLEHEVLKAEVDYKERGTAILYRGRYLRHARDGHIVLPFGLPRKLFVPFDVGADFEVGILRGPIREAQPFTVGVIRAAALVDVFRGDDFRRRVAIGIASRWDMTVDRKPLEVAEHIVVPLSAGILDVHFESKNGLNQLSLRGEAGGQWSSTQGWQPNLRGEISAERIAIAINDRPLSFYGRLTYDDDFSRNDGSREKALTADVGLRFAAF